MRHGRVRAVAATLAVLLLASACTGDDPDGQAAPEMPVEVEGEVLDRRDDDGSGTTGDDGPKAGDDGSGTSGDDGQDDEADGAGDTADASEGSGGSDSSDDAGAADGDETSDAAGDGSADRDTAGSSDAGTTGATGTTGRSQSPARTPGAAAPTPTPRATSEPAPASGPEPHRVPAGPAVPTGPVLDSDGSDWIETSSTTVERGQEPPPLTVGLLPGEYGPQRPVRCQAALEAPSDRRLVARGTLTVSLRIEAADGTVTTLPRQRIELDVTLVPGRRLELAASPPRTLDVAEVRQVTCVAELTS